MSVLDTWKQIEKRYRKCVPQASGLLLIEYRSLRLMSLLVK